MKTLLRRIKEKYRLFREWQQQPYQVAPMSNESHQCATCGTHYEGNYCPRCGQSALVGHYSFKKAFLLFLDVWGLGNRSMFRTLRDLLLRPGYMIRDYLQGMQMAYFPPFKMFFLLIALSLLVATGFNIRMENRLEKSQELFLAGLDDAFAEQDSVNTVDTSKLQKMSAAEKAKEQQREELNKKIEESSKQYSNKAYDWTMRHISLVTMLFLLLLSVPLYFFFRKGPAYPNITYSEFFVAVVYSMNMVELVSIISNFLCLTFYLDMFCYLLTVIPIKQLSGYGYLSTLFRFLLAMLLFAVVFIVTLFVVSLIGSMVYTFLFR
ncbi:MAG: DUF3667 domain-containing protein [Prevotella sp.]|nr:DUF3667 domain-containing protein [Prevotella sp.]